MGAVCSGRRPSSVYQMNAVAQKNSVIIRNYEEVRVIMLLGMFPPIFAQLCLLMDHVYTQS